MSLADERLETTIEAGITVERRFRPDGSLASESFLTRPLTQAEKLAFGAVQLDALVVLKAAVIWVAQKLGVPLATARSEILAIYKTL